MTPDSVVQHFGGAAKAAKALGIKRQAVYQWLKNGIIPPLRAYQIRVLTKGRLKE